MVGRHERKMNTAPDAVDDLVLLLQDDINEKGIVNNLRNRYKNKDIYTYIGPVLLSVNPFENIRGMYDESLMQEYYGRYKFEVAPHVFAAAEEAHRKLMGTGINQCVLISGESGAGKTEAAKKVMEYVAKVSSDTTETKGVKRTVAEIKDSLLKSNPVLEAFANAKTLRNDNSSRFGKYMQIQMDYNGTPLGGKITNYLLEKPRVVHQTPGERNFHIFYLLTEGMQGSSAYRSLNLGPADNFNYLCDNKSKVVKTIDDKEWFQEMDDAMAKVGIDGNLKMEMYQIVASILWLGNIQFQKNKSGGQDACKVSSKTELNNAAQLLSVSPAQLEEALTTRSRETTIDKVRSPLVTVDECNKVRDALAKALYARMFQLLVESINKTIKVEKAELSLGVLDIYGFEIFERNSFEQLCINYTNECLQQYFIQLTLKAEQEEYAKEGIPWKDIKYFNNKIVCDLIDGKRPAGIIAFMDEEITLARGNESDTTFLNKMNQQLKSHPHYEIPPSSKSTPDEFIVKHYAGDVKYSADGMIDKNKDTLFRDLLVLCGQYSKSRFIQDMFPEGREKHDFKKPVTAGTQFVSDMKDLIATLEKCEPHYIRTIKPNDDKRANYFNDERVLHQVKYLGLLENVRVRRAGYAYRREYNLFVRRYKMVTDKTWPNPASNNDKQNAEVILGACGVKSDGYAFGKTKIFIKDPQSLFKLEQKRDESMQWVVGIIQKAYRRWKLRLYFQKIRELAVNLFHQKKRRNNSWVLYFLGDYVNAQGDELIMQQVRENNDRKIVFADLVDVYQLNAVKWGKQPKSNTLRETMVMTAQSIYFFRSDKQGHKANGMQRIHFSDIESVGLSTFADNFIIVNLKSKPHPKKQGVYLPQPSVVFESVRKSEIATVFNEEYRGATNRDAPLIFQDKQKLVVLQKKGGLGNAFKKPSPAEKSIHFYEENALQGKRADLTLPNKKSNPQADLDLVSVAVASKLASRAELQLNADLPDRVLAHTAHGRQGKKRMVNRRRQY